MGFEYYEILMLELVEDQLMLHPVLMRLKTKQYSMYCNEINFYLSSE